MKTDKTTKMALVITIWIIVSFLMSIIYYWLFDIGLIWDNPDYYMNEKGTWTNPVPWNSRKLIMGIASLAYTVLAIVKIVNIAEDD